MYSLQRQNINQSLPSETTWCHHSKSLMSNISVTSVIPQKINRTEQTIPFSWIRAMKIETNNQKRVNKKATVIDECKIKGLQFCYWFRTWVVIVTWTRIYHLQLKHSEIQKYLPLECLQAHKLGGSLKRGHSPHFLTLSTETHSRVNQLVLWTESGFL